MRKKEQIQRITQRMDLVLKHLRLLESSKLMCNRLKCSDLRKEYKELDTERLNLIKQ